VNERSVFFHPAGDEKVIAIEYASLAFHHVGRWAAGMMKKEDLCFGTDSTWQWSAAILSLMS
jgi:hypothetical protein